MDIVCCNWVQVFPLPSFVICYCYLHGYLLFSDWISYFVEVKPPLLFLRGIAPGMPSHLEMTVVLVYSFFFS